MRLAPRLTAVLPILVAVAPAALHGQTVEEIVDRMYEAYEAQAEGIDDYTLVQEMMGFETVNYFEKEVVDGHPVFRMRQSAAAGLAFSLGSEDAGHGDVFLYGPELVEHARYGGRESVDGRSLHVLAVDDLAALDVSQPTGPDDMEFVPKTGRLFIDPDSWAPRRMEFTGEAMTDSGPQEVTMQMDMMDFRDVDGLLIPHRTVMNIGGLEAMIDPEMRAQLEEMERQLEALPPDQRQMMERMLGAQMDRIREMMSGQGGGTMTMEMTVTDVRVNAGPPNQ